MLSHILYVIIITMVFLLIFLFRYIIKSRKISQKQREMSLLQRRNEMLNETLRNPQIKIVGHAMTGPVEVQWDEKAIEHSQNQNISMMIELVEFSTYSRRKYIFPADQIINVGSGANNQLVLMREGVASSHCAFVTTDGVVTVRSMPGQKTVLIHGKVSALVGEDGVFLRDGDHIRIGEADIQFRCFRV